MKKQSLTPSKLGFGLMRLPRIKDDPNTIDVEQTSRMTDMFLEAGLTYFDTAFVYGGSEEAIRKALVERHPRESFLLADKLNAWLMCDSEETAKQQFYTSLERTGAGYFDYYLLHALQSDNYTLYDKYHIWDFAAEQKAKGLVKNVGFSFHAGPELLDQVLTAHPEMDFVQLQLNYADWENPRVTSRANYEMARKHGVPIVVMEPVKGGLLANPPKPVAEVLRAADPGASAASWAIRFVASLEGVMTVLSGMSNVEQMADNLSYMKDFTPLSADEQDVIRQAQEALARIESIPCTSCHYCTEGCPQQIPIPDIFAARNMQLIYGETERGKRSYREAVSDGGKASDCVGCGQCESACPQQIPVTERLKECAAALED